MVWAGICMDDRTDLIVVAGGLLTGLRYRDEILDPVVIPFAAAILAKVLFWCRIMPVHT